MPRNIVVCLDGTGNNNETQNTNVHCIYEMMDRKYSVANYWSGVGVAGQFVGNALDKLTGRGLFRKVREAFTFVRGNYVAGDRIFIFGFSRGAYAARHLAGMIARMGFGNLPEETFNRYYEAVKTGRPSETRQEVQFLGMFDCVPGNQFFLLRKDRQNLNNAMLEPGIRHVAHAVSRDERRWAFEPLLFADGGQETFHQAWFPGYHFDVGGDANPPLNGFALWWMLREAYGNGLAVKDLKCPGEMEEGPHHGKLGVKLGFLPGIDSAAPGRPSEYWTTRLGLRCDRPTLPGAKRVASQPDLASLDECPRGCGEDLFEYFLTDEGRRRGVKVLGRKVLSYPG